jgi:YD repeat-containing protein
MDPLGIYSSALYGYKNSLVTAVAKNARYNEIGFDSFENDQNIPIGGQRGHIICLTTNNSQTTSEFAHSGKKSLRTEKLTVNIGDDSKLDFKSGDTCLLTCWVRKANCATSDNLGNAYVFTYNGATSNIAKEPKVECWQRLEVEFIYDPADLTLELELASRNTFYVDDIRIMPADAIAKCYVYSPQNYRLLAELDENHFATYYNYDEEGTLVQIKKETERGVMTVKTTRQHIKTNLLQPQNP